MDFKQETLDDPRPESIDIKEEPMTTIKTEPNISEIKQENLSVQKVKVENGIENANWIQSQIDQTTAVDDCLYIKNDSVHESTQLNTSLHAYNHEFPGIKLEIPEVNNSEVQAKEFCVENSDLVKIKQEMVAELLKEECDLAMVKTEADFLDEPCSSQQFLLKNNTRKKKLRCTCPVCQKDAEQSKYRLKSVRGQCSKIMKPKKTSARQAADRRSKWKYRLEFLMPRMNDQQRSTSVANETLSDLTDGEDESLSLAADISSPEDPDMTELSTLFVTEHTSKKRKLTNKRTEDNFTQQTASDAVMKYLLEEERKKSEQKNELDYFFESIKTSVNKFSPADKHLAKNKIFMIVSDIEGKYIGQQLPQHTPTNSASSRDNIQNYMQYHQPPPQTHADVSASTLSMPSRPSSIASLPLSTPSTPSYNEDVSTSDID